MAVTYEVVLMNRQAMPEQYAEISLNVFHYRDPDCGIRGIHVIRGIRGTLYHQNFLSLLFS